MMFRAGIAADLDRAAARVRRVLDRGAVDRIAGFIEGARTVDGGFADRGGKSDLYYTLFGVASTRALRGRIRRRDLGAYLDRQALDPLDLVHLTCLIQCQRLCHPLGVPRRTRRQVLVNMARFRTPDGGFAEQGSRPDATPYGTYLAVLAHDVLGSRIPDEDHLSAVASRLLRHSLSSPCGPLGLSATASAILVAQSLGCEIAVDQAVAQLNRFRPANTGFLACVDAPSPDLLSTAVAAFTRRRLGRPIAGVEAAEIAAFVQSLWHEKGGFRGGEHDDDPDCEYTFYGLLALGSLTP